MKRSLRPRSPFIPVLIAVVISVLPGTAPLSAQAGGTASVHGVIVGADSLPLNAVEVTITHVATGATATTETDREGRYRLANLRPGGPYTLRASQLGMQQQTVENLRLTAGESRRVAMQLIPAPVALEGVQVDVNRRVQISPSRMGVAHVVDSAAIAALPTLNRDVLELALLSPMVHREGERVSVAGQNDRLNSFQVDGLFLQDPAGFPRGDLPEVRRKPMPFDALQQYRVAASPFDVRESGFQGGLLQAVTRSGTNTWEGTAFTLMRHESLLGSLEIDGDEVSAQDFSKLLTGFSVGGPLSVDRTHVFLAVEVEQQRQPPAGFHIGEASPLRLQLVADSVARMRELLRDVYNADPGAATTYTLDNPMGNLFARFDHRLSDNHTLTLRSLVSWSEEDLAANRDPFEPYGLSTAGVLWAHRSWMSGLEMSSRSRSGWGNQFLLQYQRLSESGEPASALPQVDVRVSGVEDGFFLSRRVRLGANAASHGLDLVQDLVEARNEVSRSFGAHHVSLGMGLRNFDIDHLYAPGSRGSWYYDTLEQLNNNTPAAYEVAFLPEGVTEPRERFSARNISGFIQDEWTLRPALTLRLGLRVESTLYPRTPERNEALMELFGEDNSKLPSGLLFSPRVGVNWYGDILGGLTQLSGGVGVFQGQIPFEWLSATYAYTGARRSQLICNRTDGTFAPRMIPGAPPPVTCPAGTIRINVPPAVQFLHRDLAPPRDLKVSFAMDRELPLNLGATVEMLYSHSLKQLFIEDLNLPVALYGPYDEQPWDGLGPRARFSNVLAPLRRVHSQLGPVVRVSNRDSDRVMSLQANLTGSFFSRSRFNLGYGYSEARTLQSLTSADIVSAFGRSPTSVDLNQPGGRPSPFLRPHTVTFTLWNSVRDRWGSTDIGMNYRGMSGRPYSYVYMGDANGDGFAGFGLAREVYNDLIYVPASVAASESPMAGPVTRSLLFQLTEIEPCLEEARGRILERSECTGPWSNRFDLKAVRNVPTRVGTFEVSGDLINVLNLMNSEWGRVSDVRPAVPLLRFDLVEDVGIMTTYTGPAERDSEGSLRPVLPYTVSAIESRWQAQLGVRVRF